MERASLSDIPQLLFLINSAYRGDSAKKGWTHEADLLKGEHRTDEKELDKIIGDPDSVMLMVKREGQLAGCLHLKNNQGNLYLGMLSVSPDKQAMGIGKQLLAAADQYGREKHCRRMYMTVISARTELIQWYKRHGYAFSGLTTPFLVDPAFGRPIQLLEFIELEKKM
jgi:N-acetylglutamate synthase-like GNAT family acetyltransferase